MARIGSEIYELVLLDQVWTAHAERNDPNGIDDLAAVVDRMDALLDHLAEESKTVLARVKSLGNDEMEAALSRAKLPDSAVARSIRDRANNNSGLRAMVEKGLQDAETSFPQEGAQVKAELTRLRTGGTSSGDMSHLTHCGVGLMETGLGLAYGGLGAALLVDGAERVLGHCAEPG